MSDGASVLKEEIARSARKEIRRETSTLKKASTAYRSEIASLKRRMLELERRLRRTARVAGAPATAATNDEGESQGPRFSAQSMAAQRRRLGLSAAECGLLIGASAQAIYNWEDGKATDFTEALRSARVARNRLPGGQMGKGAGGHASNAILIRGL
ncbi:MAG: hypothetical protein ABI460_06795 [Caldimonas sp.]